MQTYIHTNKQSLLNVYTQIYLHANMQSLLFDLSPGSFQALYVALFAILYSLYICTNNTSCMGNKRRFFNALYVMFSDNKIPYPGGSWRNLEEPGRPSISGHTLRRRERTTSCIRHQAITNKLFILRLYRLLFYHALQFVPLPK